MGGGYSVIFCMNVCSEVGEKGRVVYQEKGRLFRFFSPWLSVGRAQCVASQNTSQIEKVHSYRTYSTVRYGMCLFFSFVSSFACPDPLSLELRDPYPDCTLILETVAEDVF